ncbi:MAG: thioredoxin domain-containing protein, partial [Nitrospirae bacterium]|nr:thioredoxin domain-containing protein [Nitrospirota bacterium]
MTRPSGVEAVRWEPWGEAAFARARSEGKRVLLSISASWCHWCHVMDEESFAHPEVIRQLNERFVPVRVDSDQRPDINSRYNMGGWPTVAVLDPAGNVIAGETYLPLGPFLSWLGSTTGIESSRHRALGERGEPGGPPVKTIAAPPSPEPPALDHALVATVSDWLDRAHDRTFGGFGVVPKFPQPWAIELL